MRRVAKPAEDRNPLADISSPRVHVSRMSNKFLIVGVVLFCIIALASIFMTSPSGAAAYQNLSFQMSSSNPVPQHSAYINITSSGKQSQTSLDVRTSGRSIEDLIEKIKASQYIWEGFRIPSKDREEHSAGTDSPLTYGEILIPSMDTVLSEMIDSYELETVCDNTTSHEIFSCTSRDASPHANRVFYDIGSGAGKVTIQSFLSNFFVRSVGVEITRARFTRACDALQVLSQTESILRNVDNDKSIYFVRDSFLSPGVIHDPSHIFACSTCFSEDLMQKIVQNIDKSSRQVSFATLRGIPLTALQQSLSLWEDGRTINTPSSWSSQTTTTVYTKRRSAVQSSMESWEDVLSDIPEYCSLSKTSGKPEFQWVYPEGIDYEEYRSKS